MKFTEKDLYHGAALVQIIADGSFTAINGASSKYGHYVVNTNRRLLIKHSTASDGSYPFTFTLDDLATLTSDFSSPQIGTLVCLVCADESVCCLNEDEVRLLIDVTSPGQQWIKVSGFGAHQRMSVKGSQGTLSHKIPHNSFPGKIFG